jgi:hypothetical protein
VTEQRYNQLMADPELALTDVEMSEGWHWCNSFDGLLRNNKEEPEYQCDCWN